MTLPLQQTMISNEQRNSPQTSVKYLSSSFVSKYVVSNIGELILVSPMVVISFFNIL